MTLGTILQFICRILALTFVIATPCLGSSEMNINRSQEDARPADVFPVHVANGDAAPVSLANITGYASFFPAKPLLCRPTDHSINVNVIPEEELEIFIEYRVRNNTSLQRTHSVTARSGVPQNIVISNLKPDASYMYRLCYRLLSDSSVRCSPQYSFHTQRSPGSLFVFDVQADSHLDERASGDLYEQTLKNEQNDKPDFLIDLGDTFMTDKLAIKNNETYLSQYLRQRSFLDAIGHSIPLFLVLGNHDGEAGYALDDTPDNIAILSNALRKMYFPNPETDGFYTGSTVIEEFTGNRQDYYAWVWGDALFVVIDPYWHTTSKPGGRTNPWAWTLGEVQYNWLRDTLEKSRAKYKFVFAHQLVGGDLQGRGGIEYASFYEWGGENPDGSWGFDQHRPGWQVPIHQLLVENNVTIFFHGHDHFFARQELDGIIYQEVPQPATASPPGANYGKEYGYLSGIKLGSPGNLRVTVSPESVRVDYIWSSLPGDSRGGLTNGDLAYSYTLKPSGTA